MTDAAIDHFRKAMDEAAKLPPPTVDRCVVGRLDSLDSFAKRRVADALDAAPLSLVGIPVIVDATLPPSVIEFRLGDDVVGRFDAAGVAEPKS